MEVDRAPNVSQIVNPKYHRGKGARGRSWVAVGAVPLEPHLAPQISHRELPPVHACPRVIFPSGLSNPPK